MAVVSRSSRKLGVPSKTARVYLTLSREVAEDSADDSIDEKRSPSSRVEPPKYTSLIKAAAQGQDLAVEDLLRRESNNGDYLFETDRKGRTALDWARIRGQHTVAQTLKRAMDDELNNRANQRDALNQRKKLAALVRLNLQLRTLLEHAVREQDVRQAACTVAAATFFRDDYNRAVETLRRCKRVVLNDAVDDLPLKESLYFVDFETETGGTPLLLACAATNEVLAEDLIRRGAVVDHENKRGHTVSITLGLDLFANLRGRLCRGRVCVAMKVWSVCS